jgi:predicted nucleotidyltransferase
MAVYRARAKRREVQEKQALGERRQRAWRVANRAAALLRKHSDATRVLAFGSLAHGMWFSRTSDIDLAAWGLSKDDYFLAVARRQELSPEFRVDLVDAARCRPSLQEAVAKEGTSL